MSQELYEYVDVSVIREHHLVPVLGTFSLDLFNMNHLDDRGESRVVLRSGHGVHL